MYNPYIKPKEILNKNDNEYILVNVNRIYERMALAIKIPEYKKRIEIMKILKEAIHNIPREDTMFTSMTIKDIKLVFGTILNKLPYNTFREK